MEKSVTEKFIERVKVESSIHKFIKDDLIYQLIDYFKKDYTKMDYPQNINNHLDIVLEFYKSYNKEYYKIILEGINNNKIIISKSETKSLVDTNNRKVFIRLSGNDSDIFILAHEFAHYIDRSSNPPIIPGKYSFLCEVFSFYIEKQLELWLDYKEFYELIQSRRNNRMYYEEKMLNTIEYELLCEKLYIQNGQINIKDLDVNKARRLMRYDYDLNIGLVNYLLRYPLANLLSDYSLNNNLVKNDVDIWSICLNTNLYKIVTDQNINKKMRAI